MNKWIIVQIIILSTGYNTNQEKTHKGHLSNIRQLTKNEINSPRWDNAEAYFSFDNQRIIFQASREIGSCDQIYSMNLDGSDLKLLSNGKGRTTCSYFTPDGNRIVYASTHHYDEKCPPEPDRSKGYVWPIYENFDIFIASADGSNLTQLTKTAGYDAEATISPKGDKMVFTSIRDGDLEIYTMNLDGTDVKRITNTKGYDGGAFFSVDGKKLVFRSRYPTTDDEMWEYESLLKDNLTKPSKLDIYYSNADGSNKVRLTHWGDKGVTSWAPFFHPDGKKLIFASNKDDFNLTVPDSYGYNFELYIINIDGTGLERITFNEFFDGFPMFSFDGKKLIWCGNYESERPRDTDILIADWSD